MAKTHMGDSSFADYAPVSDRITLFYQKYPAGRIVTELHSRTDRAITFRALVFRTADDAQPAATGWASEREGDGEINAVACLENTETSAIGRALANLGFTASRERPSAEEMAKASRARVRVAAEQPVPAGVYQFGGSRTPSTLAARNAPTASKPDPVVADFLSLITRAERAGLRATRATQWRHRVVSGALSGETLLRCERRL